jgi:hypothetical protein
MPIPQSWPLDVRTHARTFLALCKYYRFSRTLSEAAVPFVAAHYAGTLSDKHDTFRAIAFITYWIASLHVLSEGWQRLGLQDPGIDPLLSEEHLETLRRYRNTVFHFQADLDDPRVNALSGNPETVSWVFALGTAYQDFFRHHDETIDVERIREWLFSAVTDESPKRNK